MSLPSQLKDVPMRVDILPNAESYFIIGFFADPDRWLPFMATLPYYQGQIKMYGKTVKEPRLKVIYGLDNNLYKYSGSATQKLPFPPELEVLRAALSKFCDTNFDSLLINYYPDGNSSIGMHSDKEVIADSLIVSISLGAVRKFKISCTKYAPIQHQDVEIELPHGSIFIMGRNFQRCYKHGIDKDPSVRDPRYNLTYRVTK